MSILSINSCFVILDLAGCKADVRIDDSLFSSMAYADDITQFSTNAQCLQNLIDICVHEYVC